MRVAMELVGWVVNMNTIAINPKSCSECLLWRCDHTSYYSCVHPIHGKQGKFYGDNWDGRDSEKAFKECPLKHTIVTIG